MKSKYELCLLLLFLPSSITIAVDYNDGQIHDITTYLTGPLPARVDYNNSGPSTTVNILPTASVYKFEVYNRGILNLLGGTVRDELWAKDSSYINIESGLVKFNVHAQNSSVIDISGGTIRDGIVTFDSAECNFSNGSVNRIWTNHDSRFTIESGIVTGACKVYNNSRLNVHGGVFNGPFQTIDTATIALYGSDFSIDGNPLQPGQYFVSDFTGGQLRGVLENGDILDVNFSFWGTTPSSLVIVPEPCTLLLLGLGGLLIRKR